MKPCWHLVSGAARAAVLVWVGLAGVARAQQEPEHAHAKAAVSSEITVTADGRSMALTVAQIEAMPQKTVTVHNAHAKADETYAGVALGDLLARFGLAVATHEGERKAEKSYVRAEGTDHYFVLYSTVEVEGAMHTGDVIVATKLNGKALGEDGSFKLVSTEDKKPARWVRNLSAISVMTVE